MEKDRASMAAVSQGAAPIFRLFRFSEPTMSYGRLQASTEVKSVNSGNWPLVQRPTAGGIVFHNDDLCFSLCWRPGTPPLLGRPQEVYRWIHERVMDALALPHLQLAACVNTVDSPAAFSQRQCFREPVGYDVLQRDTKILGGALAIRKEAWLYQGSIQNTDLQNLSVRLEKIFRITLACSS